MAGELVIPVGYAQCAIVWRRALDLQPYYTTFGVATSDIENTASNVALAVGATWTNATTLAGMTLEKVIARVAQEGDEPQAQEAAVGVVGSISATMSPQNCAVLYRKVTTRSGRQGRGRMYIPMLDEANVDAVGALTTVQQTAENTRAGNLLTFLADTTTGGATPMYLLHRPPLVGSIPEPTEVTGLSCDPVIATQRRRLRR